MGEGQVSRGFQNALLVLDVFILSRLFLFIE